MPNHSLPAGVELIDGLVRLGKALQYVTEKERPVERGRSNPPAVDVAWFAEEGQEYPLMIFEVESRATNAAANNPVKVFGQPNEAFERPLFFFHIFVSIGPETSRVENLKRFFGTYNYRAYGFDTDGATALLKDILSQHRRLRRQLNLGSLLNELHEPTWRSASITSLLHHIEALNFSADYLAEYAIRGKTDGGYRSECLRLISETLSLSPSTQRPSGYKSFVSEVWMEPLHIGLMALANPTREDWLERLKGWHRRSRYPGNSHASFGLSRDYDEFILGVAPALWAFTACLMYKVSGAGAYICDQLTSLLEEIVCNPRVASFFTALWAIHLAATLNDKDRYEALRCYMDSHGSMPHDALFQPPSMVGVLGSDHPWRENFYKTHPPIPLIDDFQKAIFRHTASPEPLENEMYTFAFDLLTRDPALGEGSKILTKLLYSTRSPF